MLLPCGARGGRGLTGRSKPPGPLDMPGAEFLGDVGRRPVKYLILIYSNPVTSGDLGGVQRRRAGRGLPGYYNALADELAASGELIVTEAPRRPVADQARLGPRGHAHQRRPVRRGQGTAGRLLPARLRAHRTGGRDRRLAAGGRARPHRGPVVPELGGLEMTTLAEIEGLLRELARRSSAPSSDATATSAPARTRSRASLAAALQWPADGIPANPKGWLTTVASRRWTSRRQDVARRRREQTAATLTRRRPSPSWQPTTPSPCSCCAATRR